MAVQPGEGDADSDSGVAIFNPFSSRPNPDFNPNRPIGPTNPQTLRDGFPGNVIPAALLNAAAARMVQRHVPEPNSMGDMGMGMTMMGAPTVFEPTRIPITSSTSATCATPITRGRSG